MQTRPKSKELIAAEKEWEQVERQQDVGYILKRFGRGGDAAHIKALAAALYRAGVRLEPDKPAEEQPAEATLFSGEQD